MTATEHLILYVDDEHANRVVFGQTFAKRFRVKCVASGDRALEVFDEEPVAVLITDQRMPGMTGEDLLARVKVSSPDTIRIIVTAYSEVDPILRAVNEGLVARYIIKPWDRAELEQILNWALQVYDLGRRDSAVQLRLMQTERMLTLGQVAASVIHDLRQPLASISLNATQLVLHAAAAPMITRLMAGRSEPALDHDERDRVRDLAQELPEIAEDLRLASVFMTDVLNQLSQFQQLRVASSSPPSVDPVAVIRTAVSMCRADSDASGCSLINDVTQELPHVRTTTSQLLQIVINVLRNAQQAVERNPEGGKVVIHALERADDVRFAVRDDGAGMSEEFLAKVGTPFFTTREEGTGLGVAQVRRLVGSAGGTMQIESAVGMGTTVIFTIPKALP